MSTASPDTVEKLKSETAACLDEAFFARLEETRKVYDSAGKDKGAKDKEIAFLDVVVRHLKRLANLHT